MNVLVLGDATMERYMENIVLYCDPEDDLYTFENHWNDKLDAAAEKLNMRLFISEFFLNKGEQRNVEKIIFFTNQSGLTEVMVLDEAMNFKKPIIFIPI